MLDDLDKSKKKVSPFSKGYRKVEREVRVYLTNNYQLVWEEKKPIKELIKLAVESLQLVLEKKSNEGSEESMEKMFDKMTVCDDSVEILIKKVFKLVDFLKLPAAKVKITELRTCYTIIILNDDSSRLTNVKKTILPMVPCKYKSTILENINKWRNGFQEQINVNLVTLQQEKVY